MKKKSAVLILILIMAVASLVTVFSACTQKNTEPQITPSKWQRYVAEIGSIAAKNYHISKDEIFLDTDIDYSTYDEQAQKIISYETSIQINYSANEYASENAIAIETSKRINLFKKQRLFAMYVDDEKEDLFIYIYNEENQKEEKYHYSNTPLFGFLQKNLKQTGAEVNVFAKVAEVLTKTITYCTVDQAKHQYTLDVKIGELIFELMFEPLSGLFDVLPIDATAAVYGLLDTKTKEEFEASLKSITGQIQINIKDEKIQSLSIQNLYVNGNLQKFSSFTIPRFSLNETPTPNLKDKMPLGSAGYEPIKIGTLSVEGRLNFKEKDNSNNLISYDLELNSSLDLVKLLVNDFDFYQIDNDNYFHLRISHKCTENCTDYCSVEQGNKFMPSNGAILDIAYSPKDFGTHNIYVSISMKSFVGLNSMPHIEGINKTLVDYIFADYQLIVIDPIVAKSTLQAATEPNGSLFNLLKEINIASDGIPFSKEQLTKMVGVFFGEGGEQIAKIAEQAFEYLNVGDINFKASNTQYGSPKNYDVKRKALHILADTVDDGVIGTKQYNNFVYKDNLKPMLDWKFIGDNDIYNIYSPSGEKIYGIDSQTNYLLPIAKDEIQDLVGGYIALNYVDITGSPKDYENGNWTKDENGEPIVGKAYILDVLNVKDTNEWQTITLKIGNPNNLLIARDFYFGTHLFEKGLISEFFNKYLYDYVDLRIKFTPLLNTEINRVDSNNNYKITSLRENEYLDIVSANVTHYYSDENIKKYKIEGKTNIFDKRSILQIDSYIFNCTGKQKMSYNVSGKSFEKTINIEKPDTVEIKRSAATKDYVVVGDRIITGRLFQLTMYLTYADTNPYTISLGLSRVKINGKDIYSEDENWHIYYDGLTEYIEFDREGQYTVSMNNFLGASISYTITAGTESNEPSTYKLTCTKALSQVSVVNVVQTAEYLFDNRTHGATGIENAKLQIRIYKLSETGSYIEATEQTDYLLNEILVNGKIVENEYIVENIPATIYDPYKISYKLSLLTEGSYQIKISILEDFLSIATHTQEILIY